MSLIRPSHYDTESPYEPRKVIKAWGLGFDLGNVLKYIARAGKKPYESAIDDLEKAQTYLALYIADLKAGQS